MTPTDLFEHLRERFGVGDYDEGSGQPYWDWRMHEVVKLKAMMRRRKTDVDELYATALYVAEKGYAIRQPFDLLQYIAEAKRAARAPSSRQDARSRLNEAAGEAFQRGLLEWAQILITADPSNADDLLKQWEIV